jgi:hypothetical protein
VAIGDSGAGCQRSGNADIDTCGKIKGDVPLKACKLHQQTTPRTDKVFT